MGLVTLTIDDAHPCPFCIVPTGIVVSSPSAAMFWVSCDGCECDGPVADTASRAIEKWNRRRTPTNAKPPPPPPTREEVEAVLRTNRLEDDDG